MQIRCFLAHEHIYSVNHHAQDILTLTIEIEISRTLSILLTLPCLKVRGFLVHRLAVRQQACANRPRGQISPSVSSRVSHGTES
ncbi:hypothetical protein NIES3275_36180 [Microchaete diplosiphon NIES-3275]|nr:hypothetical protein NIES3275_36180 [Microchaete diplosiphon NIES-3275]